MHALSLPVIDLQTQVLPGVRGQLALLPVATATSGQLPVRVVGPEVAAAAVGVVAVDGEQGGDVDLGGVRGRHVRLHGDALTAV